MYLRFDDSPGIIAKKTQRSLKHAQSIRTTFLTLVSQIRGNCGCKHLQIPSNGERNKQYMLRKLCFTIYKRGRRILDMKLFRYNLHDISNYISTNDTGHYITSCECPYTGRQHEYNDTRMSPIPPKLLATSGVYVLFYKQEEIQKEVKEFSFKLLILKIKR